MHVIKSIVCFGSWILLYVAVKTLFYGIFDIAKNVPVPKMFETLAITKALVATHNFFNCPGVLGVKTPSSLVAGNWA